MPGRFFRIFNCATAAIVVLAASADSAAAQERPAAKVYVEFEGGLVGTEMAGVIDALSGGKSQILPTRLHLPAETAGLCSVLQEQLKVAPEFCTADLLAAIQSLNERQGVKLNPDAVNAKTGVFLPAVKVTETDVERLYNMSKPAEANRLNDLLSNQAWNHVIQNRVDDVLAGVDVKQQGSPQISELTIKRIAWEFGIRDPKALSEAFYVARNLSNRNLTVSVERPDGFAKARHSSAVEHVRNWCGPPPSPVNGEGGYAEMTGHLYETKDVVACEVEGLRPEVAIMDQPIIFHPDLAGALPDQMVVSATPPAPQLTLPATCETLKFDTERHHGTLLASIVASNENKYGFRGMAPNAKLLSFVWDGQSQDRDLRNFIDSAYKQDTPQVFLFASEFAPYASHPGPDADEFDKQLADEIWRPDGEGGWTNLLANKNVRLSGLTVRELLKRKILLVASAGQAEAGDGREIDWETPMSPQNLGDYDNVLVVGACTECDKDTAAMWPRSNRSKNNNFVSLLAPGGENVPTYVSDHQVGQTEEGGGTSAAAAFTAGLAARMAACYPSAYRARSEELKERLILASRPVARADSDWLERVAGGILDPSVSMLPPDKTWLKLNDRPVRAVEFKHWCAERLKFRDNTPASLDLFSMRRLTSVRGAVIGQSVERVPDELPSLLERRLVRREMPGIPATPAPLAAVHYEGGGETCAVATNRMTDLFLARESDVLGDCANLPLCE